MKSVGLLVLGVLCLVVVWWCVTRQVTIQHFDPEAEQDKGEKKDQIRSISTIGDYKGPFNSSFNGRMAIDDQYFYDKLFDDVVYYENQYEDNYSLNDIISTGMEMCEKKCRGTCVEYGVHGVAYCFEDVH